MSDTQENFMPKVDGKSFRCKCGCNVFHKPDPNDGDKFRCNACKRNYLAEPMYQSPSELPNDPEPPDTPAPEQQQAAGDGVGLVAALEGETQEFEGGTGCFIDSEDAVKVATPYESRLAAAEKRCAEMEALLREVELEAVDIRRKPGNVLKQIREFLSGTSNTGTTWQTERTTLYAQNAALTTARYEVSRLYGDELEEVEDERREAQDRASAAEQAVGEVGS